MNSRALTNFLLILIAALLASFLGWTINQSYDHALSVERTAELAKKVEVARENVHIWDISTSDKMLLIRFEDWLQKKVGSSNISLDSVYIRTYRAGDVTRTDKRHATVTGIMTATGARDTRQELYFLWERPMELDDAGQWLNNIPTFRQIAEPPKDADGIWRNKALLLPKILRDPLPD